MRRGEDFVAMHASNALLAVTTCLPLLMASSMSCLAMVAADQLNNDIDVRDSHHGERVVSHHRAARATT